MADKKTLQLTASAEELRAGFDALKWPTDLAKLLEVEYKTIRYYVTRLPEEKRYVSFSIPKRTSGDRLIEAPATPLKIIQSKLNQVLQAVYRPRASTQGFVPNRSIVTNALIHVRQHYVLSIDLKDFFHSVNFGRVRGILMAVPYEVPERVATLIAQICCHKNRLPQGAPTSPVMSNMICARLDSQLQRLAQGHKCRYSRYADDITFSTNRHNFSETIVRVRETAERLEPEVGHAVREIIESNGFQINPEKVRLRRRDRRQEVTGLTVNRAPNVERTVVRKVRSMLHAWEKYGLDSAEETFLKHYSKRRRPGREVPSYKRVVKGYLDYLAMVKGPDHALMIRLMARYRARFPDFTAPFASVDAVWVITSEGHSLQATAFMLEGVGLITCAHCTTKDAPMKAFRADAYWNEFQISVRLKDDEMDLAVLEFAQPLPHAHSLKPETDTPLQRGDIVQLLGHPHWGIGATVQVASGHVTGFRKFMTHDAFMITARVLEGNSGGPVLNAAGRVVGVARAGADTYENAVIPISLAQALVTRQSDPGSEPPPPSIPG
jgi:RNA-directed DNA polymerase